MNVEVVRDINKNHNIEVSILYLRWDLRNNNVSNFR